VKSLGYVLVEWVGGWLVYAYVYVYMYVCAYVNPRKLFVVVLFVVEKSTVEKCGNYRTPP